MSQLFEWVIDCDVNKLGYDAQGECLGETQYSLDIPARLKWDIPEKVSFDISRFYAL